MEKKELKINLDKICEAMEDSSYERDYYLDLKTGEVLFTSDYLDDEDSVKLKDRIEENFDRYEHIPKTESHEIYQDMVDFIATVEDAHLAELLEVAINGKGAFRRFKEVLLNYPEEKERWFELKDERMEGRVREWLDGIGVSPTQN